MHPIALLNDTDPKSRPAPVIVPRSDHNISRSNISPNALKVLYRLHSAGFAGFLVGGGVRDLLLDRHPKDFDVVTDADPDQIQALFRNCRLIGRRFRLAHVRFGRDIVEVATFRAAGAEGVERDGAPWGNRTPVLALRGPRPGPLDEGSAAAAPRRGLV